MLITVNFGGERMKYKFRDYNNVCKILSLILLPLQNLLLPRIIGFIIIRLLALIGLGQYLNNDVAINIMQKIILICSISWVVIYLIFKKGVFLYDDHLVIARYTITLRNWKNRISIHYDDIESAIVNYTDLRFTKYHGSLLVPLGDNTYNVELTLKSGKKYFFSIQDQEEFCEVLNSLIEKHRNR